MARAFSSRCPFHQEWWLILILYFIKLNPMYICCLSTVYEQIISVRTRRHEREVLGKAMNIEEQKSTVLWISWINTTFVFCFVTYFILPQKQSLRIGGNFHGISSHGSPVLKFWFQTKVPKKEQLNCVDSFELNWLPLKPCKELPKKSCSMCIIMS